MNSNSGNLNSTIMGNLAEGNSPMDFVKNNIQSTPRLAAQLPNQTPAPAAAPAPIVQVAGELASTPTQVAEAIISNQESGVLPVLENPIVLDNHLTDLGNTPKPEDATAPEAPAEAEENPLLESFRKSKTKEDSIKDLKNIISTKSVEVQTLSSKITELETALSKYTTGEEIPEPIRAKLDRVSELEKYESLHALKLSPEFNDRIVQPRNEKIAKLESIASEYKVPAGILNQALSMKDKREVNSYLRQYFDEVGALEVRNTLEEIRAIDNEAATMEREPAEAFNRLQTEIQAEKVTKERVRLSEMSNTSKTGWTAALSEIRDEASYPELILRDGNEDHNKIARPVIENAAKEFGKFVNWLASMGVSELQPEVAKILAKRFQLSEAALVISKSRDHFYNEAQKIIDENKRQAIYARPPLGGSMAPTGNSAPVARTAPQNAVANLSRVGEDLINSIVNR